MSSRDWEKCFLCQVDKDDQVRYPAANPKQSTDLREAYSRTVKNVLRLKELGALPDNIPLTSYDNDADIVELMLVNSVCWHKSCKNSVDSQKVARAEKASHKSGEDDLSRTKRRRVTKQTEQDEDPLVKCCLCNEKGNKKFYKVSTFDIDRKIRAYAFKVRKYHLHCLTKLYREAESVDAKDKKSDDRVMILKGQAFSELIDYVESLRGKKAAISKGELYHLYTSRLISLGLTDLNVHRTRFRQDILASVPDLTEVKNPSGHFDLIYDDDLTEAIQEFKINTEEKMMILAKAAKILRQDILDFKQNFSGAFTSSSGIESLSQQLLSFVQLLLDGPGILKDMDPRENVRPWSATLSISQLIIYNAVKRRSPNPTSIPRHICNRKTPVAIYNAVKVYLHTGKECLVDSLHQEGLAISIDRLCTISVDIANSVIERWKQIGVVVPCKMKADFFTTGALDNLDHNKHQQLHVLAFMEQGYL